MGFYISSGAGDVLPLVAIAALCHELGHIAVLRLFGMDVQEISLTAFGAEIRADTQYLSYGRDILCTLAGPGVNIILALILARWPGDYLQAGANFIQGAFNLLPLPGSDGGRALHLLVSWGSDPILADRICRVVQCLTALVLFVVTAYLVLIHRTGGFLLLAAAGVFFRALRSGN